MVVYQAYKPEIAEYAVAHQTFGGPHFSYSRMSWIKPNFLWMMYRCGWASKENQEAVLAIWLKKTDFEIILDNAAYSSYQENVYQTHEHWKEDLQKKEVRIQWDPDHDPYGNKQPRRAIQLGMKGKMLQTFGNEMVQRIENITEFVKQQKLFLDSNQLSHFSVPLETVYITSNTLLNQKLGIQ